ncbi:MAG: glycosyltransferase family 39 protein [Planctomycetota bacterium]|nr:glycosyltransferase family 39 protein [Planctomycetota bacterium]
MDVLGVVMPGRFGQTSGRRALAGTWWGGLLLVLICLAVYLPAMWNMPPVDRDESRFAQASRQMAESGDWVIPKVGERPRLNKPPLIYWVQARTAQALSGGDVRRDAIWMYRVPSLVSAVLVVLLTWRLGCSMFAPNAAWAGAALVAICPLMAWEARQARADMLMIAFTTAAVWLLWETLRRPSVARAAALWIAVGFGVLAKGPAPPLIIGMTLLVWCVLRGSLAPLRATRPLLGVAIVGVTVMPWVLLVAQRVGFENYLGIIHTETLGRSVEGAEGHWGPPGYHLVLTVVMFFPGSLWLVGSIVRGVRVGLRWEPSAGGVVARVRGALRTLRVGRPAECFLLCVLVPSWIVFEAIGTKLPHYVMPLYPALALLAARAAMSRSAWLLRWRARPTVVALVRAWCIAGVLVGATGGLVGVLAASAGAWWAWGVVGASVAGVLAFLIDAHGQISRRDYSRVLTHAAGLGAASLVMIGVTLAHAPQLWVVDRLVKAAGRHGARDTRPLAFVELHEDSSRFLTRGRVVWLNEHDTRGFLRENPDALIVMPAPMAARWRGFRTLDEVSGFNYPKGAAGTWRLGEFPP